MDDDDEYIFFGTPLPEIEDETVLRKKATRELEVRDEKGRQRFHGAFTGGFSAGYFNTVGTKEGWAPSTFVSSRNKLADRVQHNPEDFMDTEDLGEFGIATRRITTTSNFVDSNAESRKRKYPELDSVIPGEAPLKDIVKPVRESIGIQILNKLGWRLGQGIGPRVKKQTTSKVYGCAPFPSNSTPDEDDPTASSYTFAPEDTTAELFLPKDNVFGLGYTGLSKESVLGSHIDLFTPTSTKSFLKKDKKKLTISGQAFGVGAFEDDDEDIYSKDDMSQYDFSELNPKNLQQSSRDKNFNKPSHSSTQVLEGFCKSSQPPPIKKHYPPPNLPQRYRPLCSTLPKITPPVEQKFTSRHSLSASDRSLLLGEKNFKPFKLPEKKKEATNSFDLKLKNFVSSKSSPTFRPFPNDDMKQKRYEEYLKLQDTGDVGALVQPSSMTEWERQQELEEFSRSAVLFRPLASALSAKFESKSHLNVEHEVMDALVKAKKETAEKTVDTEKRKLVGLHNRKTVEWHPASLLCKRFNVPNPYPDSSEPSSKPVISKSLFDNISFQTNETDSSNKSSIPVVENRIKENVSVSTKELTEKVSEIPVPEEETKIENIQQPESKRPPIDFFRDIFGNSSSEDEDNDDSKPKEQPAQDVLPSLSNSGVINDKDNLSSIDNVSPVSKVSGPNKKPGFGVFANLDLDALNQRTSVNKPVNIINADSKDTTCDKKETEHQTEMPENKMDTSVSIDIYGPELPPGFSVSRNSSSPEIIHQSFSTPGGSKKPKHKAKHKHKHHKHKSKKKKKKKSSHKSSDSSVDTDEDISDAVIIEKFKKVQKYLR